ncbi:MAG: dynamin family protein [Deltaproteobacteria bacterium]
MKRLGEYCVALEARLRPLVAPLDALAAGLHALPAATPERAAAATEIDAIQSRLAALLAKAAAQQAFMIVFGPLKSGKSTLMNALAGAYVSEVSSLPAYPCMVFVGDAAERKLEITHYDGSSTAFASLDGMRELLAIAHAELAAELRHAEEQGRDLDPERDLPGAIRRIDVRMPAPPLAESGAMLVDTPGLYSRMKFGYDLMAREFRDKAASAIFVVKTDNLFLEQIFDEFTDLLGLFSRIFLVVNLDSSKRDLVPGGALAPSLEQVEPGKIVEAFERLGMNAELRRAVDEGRLEIYPVDLLRAARRRLQEGGMGRPDESTQATAVENDGFARLERDVLHYLSGNEFVQAFIRDTTRQAAGLLEDLNHSVRSGVLADIAVRAAAIEDERARAIRHASLARDLVGHDWERAFSAVRDDVRRLVGERTESIGPNAIAGAEDAVARWYEGDASLDELLRQDIAGLFRTARRETIEIAADVSRTVVGSDVSAAIVRAGLAAEVEPLEVPFAEIAREALAAVTEPSREVELAPAMPTRLLPVRRSWLDWLLLRSPAGVRRHLLGPDDAPARRVPRAVKKHRLDAARPVLAQALRQRIGGFAEEALSRATNEVFGRHIAAVCRELRAHLAMREAAEAELASQAAVQLEALAAVGTATSELAGIVRAVEPEVLALAADLPASATP